MIRALIFTSVLLGLSVIAGPALAQGGKAPGAVVKGELGARLDDYMTRLEGFGFSGTLLVAKDGDIVLSKGYGVADKSRGTPMTAETVISIGSITKQFTSMLVLQLVQEGKIKVEGKLTDYLPDYRKDTGDRITIHQLLNHTSGIPSYTSLPNFFQEISRKNRLCLLNRCQ